MCRSSSAVIKIFKQPDLVFIAEVQTFCPVLVYRSLRCARTTLHMHLFASFAINNALWLLWYRIVVNQPEVIVDNGSESPSFTTIKNNR
ncbi:hypothetical protein ANN_16466 [Periplaneta americana]|uniref:Uncharacterized protein n=1 Tax=Periplaneta americana TaxID=6978 RepID=A0ABQ8SK15_PERAM|nr:hypothetical protein ANN_16466 [Periplaneta americana]